MMTQDELDDDLVKMRELLRGSDLMRIELSLSFSLSAGTSFPTAQLWEKKQNGRWVKVGPFIVPPEGGTRADLLRTLAGLVENE